MPTISAIAQSVFRDFEVNGDESSGDHEVVKADVIALFEAVQSLTGLDNAALTASLATTNANVSDLTDTVSGLSESLDGTDATAAALAGTVSDLSGTVSTLSSTVSGVSDVANNAIAKDGSVTATADIRLGGHRLIGVSDPSDAQDAATKAYVDLAQNGTSVSGIVNAPTGSEPDGTRYIIGESPTGTFAGKAGYITEKFNGQWVFAAPRERISVFNSATGTHLIYVDGWRPLKVICDIDFGISADRSATDNTLAFQKMATTINAAGGGKMIITQNSKVMYQTIGTSPYYQSGGNLLSFTGCDGLVIEFAGGSLTVDDGLHFGSFDPSTGAIHTPAGGGFTDATYAASVGNLIIFDDTCSGITIINPKLDGNAANAAFGGYWGDQGYQLPYSGIFNGGAKNLTLIAPNIQDFGLDGYYQTGTNDADLNTVLINPTLVRNGRNCLSWTGGDGLTTIGGTIGGAGQGGMTASAPRAGMDIEANSGFTIKRGRFYGTYFPDCEGVSVLSPSAAGVVSDVKFFGCTLRNTTARALWFTPGAEFFGCKVYGSVTNIGSSKLYDCYNTNKYPGDPDGPNTTLFLNITSAPEWHGGTIECTDASNYNFNFGSGGALVDGTKFLFSQKDPAQQLSLGFAPTHLKDVTFKENFTWTGDAPTWASGDYAFVSAGSIADMFGRVAIVGNHIAWTNRLGVTNAVVNTIKQSLDGAPTTVTLSGSSPFSIPVGSGHNIVQLTKVDGTSGLRNVAATFIQNSAGGGSSSNNSLVKLGACEGPLGSGGSIAAAFSSGDQIVITEGTVTLSGQNFVVRKFPLDGPVTAL